MKKIFAQYTNSFKFGKKGWLSLISDTVALLLVVFFFKMYTKLIQHQSLKASQGKSVEQLKVALLSNLDAVQTFASDVKILLFILVGGLILFFFLSLVTIALSRMQVWQILVGKKAQNWWRWSLTTILLLVFGVLYLILPITFSLFLSINAVVKQALLFAVVLIYVIFGFFVYYALLQKQKVWEAFGHAFFLIKKKWTDFWKAFLLVLSTLLVVGGLFNYVQLKFYFSFPQATWLYLTVGLLLLYVAWVRSFVARILLKE